MSVLDLAFLIVKALAALVLVGVGLWIAAMLLAVVGEAIAAVFRALTWIERRGYLPPDPKTAEALERARKVPEALEDPVDTGPTGAERAGRAARRALERFRN